MPPQKGFGGRSAVDETRSQVDALAIVRVSTITRGASVRRGAIALGLQQTLNLRQQAT